MPGYHCGHGITETGRSLVATEGVELDPDASRAIERGLKAADEGRLVSSDEVRKLIPQWISKFSTQNPSNVVDKPPIEIRGSL